MSFGSFRRVMIAQIMQPTLHLYASVDCALLGNYSLYVGEVNHLLRDEFDSMVDACKIFRGIESEDVLLTSLLRLDGSMLGGSGHNSDNLGKFRMFIRIALCVRVRKCGCNLR